MKLEQDKEREEAEEEKEALANVKRSGLPANFETMSVVTGRSGGGQSGGRRNEIPVLPPKGMAPDMQNGHHQLVPNCIADARDKIAKRVDEKKSKPRATMINRSNT